MKKRRIAYHFGQLSEWIAVAYLMLKGYQILEHNYRTKVGEIDLIAKKKSTLVIIEVKARKTYSDFPLSFKQQQRIAKAATLYLIQKPKLQILDLRFDLIIISVWKWPKHMKNVWVPRS